MESATSSIRADEAAHFGAMAADWWDPKGSSAMLHRLNPVRLRYIREAVDAHWGGDAKSRMPLVGKRALDMGCGAGLLAEPLARMGADVVGVDAAFENIAVARAHAEGTGLAIDYRCGGIEAVSGEKFDLVTCMEVIEHVADPAAFAVGLARALNPPSPSVRFELVEKASSGRQGSVLDKLEPNGERSSGLMILSTPNRTPLSRLALITIGEGLGQIPRGTHDWDRFLTPEQLTGLIEAAGLSVTDTRGLSFSPTRGFILSDDLKLDYFMTAKRERANAAL